VSPSGGDDTAAFVAAVTNNTSVTVSGHLLINQIATLSNVANKTITFQSGAALTRTIRPATVTYQVLVFVNSSHITINNLQILGPNIEVCDWFQGPPINQHIKVGYQPQYESQHGIAFYGGSDYTINGGYIYGVNGDGIYFSDAAVAGPNGGHITRAHINGVSTKCTGRAAITNVGSTGVVVTGGNFDLAGYWIFNIEPYTTHVVADYTIDQPIIGYSNQYWLFSAGPNYSCKVTNVTVNKPTFVVPPSWPPYLASCTASEFHIVY
jgi:hypothetical protein